VGQMKAMGESGTSEMRERRREEEEEEKVGKG
jgi:hypothetical protein